MKKIVNKLRFMLLLGFVAIGVTAWSQAVPYINKMSITTQMFLDEMAGRISFDEAQAPTRLTAPGGQVLPKLGRPIVSPDTIDGRVYIASFIRVNDKSVIGELEALGVEIQCEFKNGTLVTANLPIDAIEQVAALEGVKKINVSSMMRPLTNNARSTTNVDDVLTLSNDARNAGLLQTYDGSGVVLGIIDNGIDYQHKAFTDKDGNSRIVGAYCYTGSSLTADWTGSGTLPTTDDSSEDHGTHTSSIAGGSSVKVSGTTVTVTDDHSQATYGGMAPGADLFLAGVDLSATYCINAFQRMANYADAVGKPLVVSNSWGSGFISNDGTTDVEDALSDYFGDSHPNHICLFAAGNEAGRAAYGSVNGGFWVGGTSTEANPLGTIIRTRYDYENYGYYYYGTLANCWTRATDADGIGINIYVINKTSGELQASYSFKSTDAGISTGEESNTVNVSSYFGSNIALYFDYSEGKGKHQALLYSGALQRGSGYALAIEVYPIGGSDSNVDIWGGDFSYFAGNVSTSGHTWTAGSDDNSATGESINENVISVGSYVSRSGSGTNSLGDISDFSSYSVSGTGPTGIQQPWITAPGDIVISALNHYVSSYNHGTVTVNSSSSPYGEMSGTSMATPVAAGIVALWMQAAQEVGKDLTLSEVKNIMKETAIRDNYVTSGANASHFGNGKIDALAGVQYILDNYGNTDPSLSVDPSAVSIEDETNGNRSATVDVVSADLTDQLSVSASTNWNAALSQDGTSMTVTYNGKALHQTGAATVSSVADGLTATVAADYLYTGPIYILGNESNWSAANGVQMTRNSETGIYTATITAQNSGDGYAYVGFTKRLGSNSSDWSGIESYRFGPVSNDQNWALVNQWADHRGEDCPLDTVGNVRTIQMPAGSTYVITVNSIDNTFMIKEAAINSSVSPAQGNLAFGQVVIGASSSRTITITNDGDLPFTPSVSGLTGSFSTDYVPAELAPGESATITITYAPTSEESESLAFTVSDGVNNYSWSISGTGVESGGGGVEPGSGVTTKRLRSSNVVAVPVYKTEMEVYAPYTLEQVEADDLANPLPAGVTNAASVQIDSKRPIAINGYNLYHNAGTASNTVSDDNWAVQNHEISFSIHDKVSSAYLPYNRQGEDFVQSPITLFPTSTEVINDIWVNHIDNVTVTNQDTYYVPVVVANGKVTQGNTYGSPIEESPLGDVVLNISHSEGKTVTQDGNNWMWITAGGTIAGFAPTLIEDGHHYEGYGYRVWRVVKQADGTPVETVKMLDVVTSERYVSFGSNMFPLNPDGTYAAGEYSFLMPVGGLVEYIGRFYYVRSDNPTPMLRVAEEVQGLTESSSENLYYVVETTGSDTYTSIDEYETSKTIVDVTYVNPLGMTSSEPFDGVNIIVTRYDDGTTTTVKVLK